MKQIACFVLICFVTMIASCSSYNQYLKETDIKKYNSLCGKWYVLSAINPSDILFTFILKDNDSIENDDGFIAERCYGGKFKHYWIYNGDHVIEIHNVIKNEDSVDTRFKYGIDDDDLQNVNPSVVQMKDKIGLGRNGKGTIGYFIAVKEENYNDLKNAIIDYNKNISIKWDNLNRTSIKDHVDFIKAIKDDKLIKMVTESLHLLIDQKVMLILESKYPKNKKVLNKQVRVGDRTFDKFYRYFISSLASINHESGYKINSSIIDNTTDSSLIAIEWQYAQDVTFEFETEKNTMRLINVKRAGDTVEGWPIAIDALLSAFTEYPDINHIDYELLDSVK